MKLVVTVPAYNEENSIGKVIKEIPRIQEKVDRVEILVINDGSTDHTADAADIAGADRIISHVRNLGLGVSFRDGLNEALDMGADVIVNIDADLQYNGAEIPKLIEPILQGNADIVIGDRQIDKLDHMPTGKVMGNKLATWVTRRITHLPIRDAQSGFRAFSREAALKMNLTGDYTYVQETLIQAANKNLVVDQIPIEFRKRSGESRLVSNLLSYAMSAGATMVRSYRDYQPLKAFTAIGVVFLIIGLVAGLRVIRHYLTTGTVTPYLPSAVLTTVLVIVGLQAVVFGLLADMLKTQRTFQEEILYRLKK
ncbi:MAG: glycosyltransferase family 2 protein [Methanotrichaceae archaeon]|nr:glycosyltransferase family 2 protein [Methanotrichaceae archaeon]